MPLIIELSILCAGFTHDIVESMGNSVLRIFFIFSILRENENRISGANTWGFRCAVPNGLGAVPRPRQILITIVIYKMYRKITYDTNFPRKKQYAYCEKSARGPQTTWSGPGHQDSPMGLEGFSPRNKEYFGCIPQTSREYSTKK